MPRGRAVAPVRRSRSHWLGRERLQAATTSTARFFIHSLLLRLSVLTEAEDLSQPRCRALPRGRAGSPSHRSPPNPGHGSALGPSISFTSCLSPSSRGKGTLSTFSHSELTGAPLLLRSSVASTAPCTSAFPSACSFFPTTRRCSSDDATTNAGQAGPERGRALSRHCRR
jgi:hypothetical protein